MVFLMTLTIRALLTINYGKLLKRRRTKNDIIKAQEKHQLNPIGPDDLSHYDWEDITIQEN